MARGEPDDPGWAEIDPGDTAHGQLGVVRYRIAVSARISRRFKVVVKPVASILQIRVLHRKLMGEGQPFLEDERLQQ
jgi:hypothetical protein